MSKYERHRDRKSPSHPVTLTADEARRVAGGGITITADQVWDALAQAEAAAKPKSQHMA